MGKLERQKKLAKDRKKLGEQAVLEKRKDASPDTDVPKGGNIEGEYQLPEELRPIQKRYLTEDDLVRGFDNFSGPTSFEELDAVQVAQEKAYEVNDLTYKVSDLVRNITRNVVLSPEEKGKAISKVGTDFGSRLKKVSGEKIEKSLDMDVLELRVLLAKHKRNAGVLDRMGEWISKSRIDSDEEYPLGNKIETLFSIEKAAKVLDENPLDTTAREIVPMIKQAAKEHDVCPLDSSKGSIVIQKDLQGVYRAVMWPSNNFVDWDDEIISEAGHKEYVEWVNKNMDLAPVFTMAHKPGLVRKNRVDFAGYESGFLIMSAPLEVKEAEQLLRVQLKTDLGMSHGTIPLEYDPKDPRVITKYRMVEVSDLPLERAANPFTDFVIVSKEAKMNIEEYLAEMIGPEDAKKFIEKTGMKQTNLRAAGVEEKAKADPETPLVAPATSPVVETPAAPVSPNLDMQAILKAVGEKYGLEDLNTFLAGMNEATEKVKILEPLVKELSKSKEETLAEIIQPANPSFIWMKKRSSQDSSNVIATDTQDPKEKELKNSVPTLDEAYWFSNQLGVEPLKQS